MLFYIKEYNRTDSGDGDFNKVEMEDFSYILNIATDYLAELQNELKINREQTEKLTRQIKINTSLNIQNSSEGELDRLITENKSLIKVSNELIKKQEQLLLRYQALNNFLRKFNEAHSRKMPFCSEAYYNQLGILLVHFESKEDYEKCLFIKNKMDELKTILFRN